MRYIIYTRDESGILNRHARPVNLDDMDYQASDFRFPEPLRGWPETAVYWPRATGPAVGIAPTA